jgi:CubicO group peptidase (beta-lactamase class C family)
VRDPDGWTDPVTAPEPPPATDTDPIARLDAWLERKRVQQDVPGMAIAVVEEGEVVLLKGYGVADQESGQPVDAQTLFSLGSCTKTFTAVLGAMAVETGAVGWDDPVAKHLPGLAPKLKDAPADAVVTLQDVFSHRTGVGRLARLWADRPTPLEEVLAAIPDQDAVAPFRRSFEYSNVMYAAGGAAVAKALGGSWHEVIRQRILTPLDMGGTHTWQTVSAEDPALAVGYQKTASGHRVMPWIDRQGIAPAGGLDATITDLSRWVLFLTGGGAIDGEQLVSREQLEHLWKPRVELAPGVAYGSGWFVRDWNGRRLVDHPGNGDQGFFCQIALLPDEGKGFALLGNVKMALVQHEAREGVFDVLEGREARDMKPAG